MNSLDVHFLKTSVYGSKPCIALTFSVKCLKDLLTSGHVYAKNRRFSDQNQGHLSIYKV